MKFLVVLAVAVACAAADVSHIVKPEEYVYGKSVDYAAPIVKSTYEHSPEGHKFNYEYETGNGIAAHAEGVVKNPESDEPTLEVRGIYRYTAPDGTPIETSYIANENGYIAQGSHIPVAPEIPEAILRSLAYIEAHPPAVVPERVYSKP